MYIDACKLWKGQKSNAQSKKAFIILILTVVPEFYHAINYRTFQKHIVMRGFKNNP